MLSCTIFWYRPDGDHSPDQIAETPVTPRATNARRGSPAARVRDAHKIRSSTRTIGSPNFEASFFMDRRSRTPLSPIRFLERSASVWRDRVAIGFEGTSTTYARLFERVERAAAGLRAAGVEEGDRVATLLPNVPAMLELHFAVPGAGAVLVPMNTRLSATEHAYILGHSGATCVVADREMRHHLDTASTHLARPPRIVYVGERSEYERLATDSARLPLVTPDEDALLSINYTSGTTGKPKGAMYTHRGAYLQALGVIAEAGLDTSSAYLWALPMFHCNGWAYTWAVTAMGARHECLGGFNAAEVWRLLEDSGITHLCAAPTVLTMLAEAPEAVPLKLPVRVFVGGSPPSPSLLARARELRLRITHLYGLTETYGPLAVCAWRPSWEEDSPAEQARLQARQGVGTIVTEPLRVVDADMRDIAADGVSIGEIVMRGNNVTSGYYRDPVATERAFSGGWFHSGDLAVMHPDGYVELRDRLKDIIISGGENISTIEVEQALVAHAAVIEAAVIGVADERWGEVPKAFVTVRDGSTVDPTELLDFVGQRLARFKVPKEIEFVTELPKTATGKVQKFVLRAAALDTPDTRP